MLEEVGSDPVRATKKKHLSFDRCFFLVALSGADLKSMQVLLEGLRSLPIRDEPPVQPDRPPRQRLLSLDEEAEAVALYKAGRTAKEVADQFGIHRLTVSRAVRRAGGRVGREPLTAREVERAKALYERGLPIASVAKELSLPRESIRRQLIQAGVVMRSKGRPAQV